MQYLVLPWVTLASIELNGEKPDLSAFGEDNTLSCSKVVKPWCPEQCKELGIPCIGLCGPLGCYREEIPPVCEPDFCRSLGICPIDV